MKTASAVPVRRTRNKNHVQEAAASPEPAHQEPTGLLKSSFVAWLGQRAWLLVTPLYVLLRGWNLYFISPEQDTQRYFDIGGRWLLGQTPYAQVPCEYPPGALPLFALPRFFTSLVANSQEAVMQAYQAFCYRFAAEMVVFDLAILALLVRLAAQLGPKTHTESEHNERKGQIALALASYIVMTSILGKMAFQRFDLAFACLILGFVSCALEPKQRWAADLLLAVSVWVKIASLPLVPLYIAYLALEERKNPGTSTTLGKMMPHLSRISLKHGTRLAGFLLALFLPFYLYVGSALKGFYEYQANRGLQIESTLASLTLLWSKWSGYAVQRTFAFGASEVQSGSSDNLAHVSSVIVVLLTLLVLSAWVPRQALHKPIIERRRGLVEGVLATMLIVMFGNKVFSPQFLLWTAPLVAALIYTRRATLAHDLVGLGSAHLITSLIVMFYYLDLLRFDGMPVALLVLRNLLVGGMALSLVGLTGFKEFNELGQASIKLLSRPKVVRALCAVAITMVGFWIFAANMSETTANDIWIQLRSGADIWRSKSVPQLEQYSATVSGKPFLAHEWLSGLWFFWADMLLGDAGLSTLTAVTAFAIWLTLHYAFERRVRQTFWYVPLLIYVNYLIAFRLLARPHIFTCLGQAIMITGIERWRRSGRISALLPFIPMQIVWINLHGAALFGPALMGMVAGCVMLMVLVPRLGESEQRTMAWSDVRVCFGVTLAMMLACLINPYSTKIVTFSLDLMGNEYAKNRVWEWTTPFLRMNTYYYWLYLFMSMFVMMWGSLLYRIKELPLLDVSYTVLASYLGLRANRFMPDFAMLAFPVMARSLDVVMRKALPARLWGRQPWLEIGFATLLITNCAVYGYAHSANEHRPLFGWGYGGDMPFVEVDLMKKLHLKGIIYNEYSDGSLIINKLVPDIKPVLDSRIDLYPLDFVDEYDRAYLDPQLFATFLKRHNCNIVMLYKNRTSPQVLQYLAQAPEWRLLLDTNGRVLYATETALAQARARERQGRGERAQLRRGDGGDARFAQIGLSSPQRLP